MIKDAAIFKMVSDITTKGGRSVSDLKRLARSLSRRVNTTKDLHPDTFGKAVSEINSLDNTNAMAKSTGLPLDYKQPADVLAKHKAQLDKPLEPTRLDPVAHAQYEAGQERFLAHRALTRYLERNRKNLVDYPTGQTTLNSTLKTGSTMEREKIAQLFDAVYTPVFVTKLASFGINVRNDADMANLLKLAAQLNAGGVKSSNELKSDIYSLATKKMATVLSKMRKVKKPASKSC